MNRFQIYEKYYCYMHAQHFSKDFLFVFMLFITPIKQIIFFSKFAPNKI